MAEERYGETAVWRDGGTDWAVREQGDDGGEGESPYGHDRPFRHRRGMDAAAETAISTPEAFLELDLATYPAEFAAAVRSVLGQEPDEALSDGIGIVTHLIISRGPILAFYAVTGGGLLIHEQAQSGVSLTVAVPSWQLTRIEISRGVSNPGETRLLIEISGDRRRQVVDGDGTVTLPAGYEVLATGDEAEAVWDFATELRCALLGLR